MRESERGKDRKPLPTGMRTQYLVLGTPLFALLFALSVCGDAQAQTRLRWKLKAGESFVVDALQETESQVAFGGKSVSTKIDLTLQLTWTVTAATEKEFVIKQSIDRIQIK